jgi:CheY-like chemotaxis protein
MTGPAVLLVEDDRELAGMLERLLRSEGYEVSHAPDGHTALHLGLTQSFDALVVDRGLPAIEGLDLLVRLRGRGVTTPALILSSRATVGDRIAGLDAGAEDYLTKPFDVDELLARVRALLRRHTEAADVLSLGSRILDVEARLVRGPAEAAAPASASPSARRCCWPCWRGDRSGSSAGASCASTSSPRPSPTWSSTPTSTTADASWAAASSVRCAASATSWGRREA